jgi:hypothetical protein
MIAAVLLTSVCAVGGIAFAVLRKAPPAGVEVSALATTRDAGAPERGTADTSASNLAAAEPATAREPATSVAPQAAAKSGARVHGRILLPGGAPAAGLIVDAKSFSSTEGRMIEIAKASCGADGRFEIVLKPDDPSFLTLHVEREGCVNAVTNVGDLGPGKDSDIGELTLARGSTLRCRLVDAQSRPLVEGWEVFSNADAPQTHSANKRWVFINRATVDVRDGTCALTGLPAGEMTIVSQNPLCRDLQIRRKVTIVEGQEATAEFSYSGPDLAQRILVRTKGLFAAHVAFDPSADAVHVLRVGESSARRCTKTQPGQYVYDGLEPGDYSIEIDDAKFVRWVEPHVQPGHVVTAKLVGAANVRLAVVGADGKPITRYGVTVVFPGASFVPNEFELLAKGSTAPADGRIEGLIPHSSVLVVAPEGLAERRVRLDDLRRGETREVRVDYSQSAAITGRIVDLEGNALSRVAVELTLGERAGVDAPSMTTGVTSVMRGGVVETAVAITRKAASDEHGRFEFGNLERGMWTVRARFSRWVTVDKTITLGAEAAPALEVTRPPSGSLLGKLVLPAGASAADVELLLDKDFASAAMDEKSKPTIAIAADGTFRVGPLPVGAHMLRALVAAGARANTDNRGSHESFQSIRDLGRFEISAGRDYQQVFDLAGVVPARVNVTATANGAPLENASLTMTIESRSGGAKPVAIALDARGQFTIAVPARERVHLTVVAQEQGWIWRSSEVIEASSGEKLARTIDVPIVHHTLRLLDARTRAPLALHAVRWTASIEGLSAEGHGTSDAQGNLELALPPGHYELASTAGGEKASLDLGSTPVAPIEVLLDRGG